MKKLIVLLVMVGLLGSVAYGEDTEMEALKTKSVALSVMGTTGFLCAWLGSILFPMV